MLRMHDHLKYPYFVAFYENRVKVGLKPKNRQATPIRIRLLRMNFNNFRKILPEGTA